MKTPVMKPNPPSPIIGRILTAPPMVLIPTEMPLTLAVSDEVFFAAGTVLESLPPFLPTNKVPSKFHEPLLARTELLAANLVCNVKEVLKFNANGTPASGQGNVMTRGVTVVVSTLMYPIHVAPGLDRHAQSD